MHHQSHPAEQKDDGRRQRGNTLFPITIQDRKIRPYSNYTLRKTQRLKWQVLVYWKLEITENCGQNQVVNKSICLNVCCSQSQHIEPPPHRDRNRQKLIQRFMWKQLCKLNVSHYRSCSLANARQFIFHILNSWFSKSLSNTFFC